MKQMTDADVMLHLRTNSALNQARRAFSSEVARMEQHLAQRRWEFIDEAEFRYHFDLHRLILYYLKLKILERLASFEKDKGQEKDQSIVGFIRRTTLL